MKTRNFVTIILKLMGFYVFMQFMLMLPTSFRGLMAFRSASANAMDGLAPTLESLFVYLLVVSFIYLAFSVGLFFAAQKLSRFFVEDPDEEIALSVDVYDGMQTWAFRCFGVYALITWGPSLVQTLCQTIVYGTWQSDPVPFLIRFYQSWSLLIGPTTGVILGLLLIFKTKGLVRLIQLSRPMSRQRVELENEREQPQPEPSNNEDASV